MELIRTDVVVSVRAALADHQHLDLADITMAGPFIYRRLITDIPQFAAPCHLEEHFS